jgi:hypothetical protein
MKKSIIWGLAIGLLLAILNSLALGAPGMGLFMPIIPDSFDELVLKCGGEDCWGPWIFFGDALFILSSVLIALMIRYVRKK